MHHALNRHANPKALFLALTTAACAEPAVTATAPAERMTPAAHSSMHRSGAESEATRREVARLRDLTRPFHKFQNAVDAGWGTRITDCFSDPALGGMGYHYGNPALIDGSVDALQPELLLYEPLKNGKLRFVAVEYIVPFAAWTQSSPPRLYGQDFHRNEAFGLWVLHVWHVRDNPRGIFADWNPRVTCRYATP